MVCFYYFKFILFNNIFIIFKSHNLNVQVAQRQSVRLKTSRSLVQIQSWTKVSDFLLIFSIFVVILELINYSSILVDQIIFYSYFYELLFLLLFLLSFLILNRKEKFNFSLDLLFKYYLLFFKTPSFFFNFVLNTLKQIYIFTLLFKYKFLIDTNKIFFNFYFSKLSLLWRPLFKKFSYFGYYRSNRSKWIK